MRSDRSLAALLLALLAGPLAADEGDAKITIEEEVTVEGEAPYLPEQISTATKTSTPLRLLPQSATSVSAALFTEQDARVLSDALAYTPGVNVESQFGIHDFFLIRGFDSLSSSLILTDGALEPEATFYRTYNLERIELLRGTGGFIYGGNATSGLVNLVRKRPVSGTFTRLGLSGGSDSNLYATLDANHGARDGRWATRVNAQWQQGDGYREGKDFDTFAVNPAVSWSVGEHTAMSFNVEYLENNLTPDSGLPILSSFSPIDFSLSTSIPDVPRERSYDSPFDFSDQEMLRLRFDLETKIGSGVTLRSKTYLTDLDWNSRGTLSLGAFQLPFSPFASVIRLRNTLDDQQSVLGSQLDFVLKATTGSVEHEITAGIELQRLDDEFTIGTGFLPEIDLFAPVETAVDQDFLFLTQGADVTTDVIAPYVLDTLKLNDRWRLSLGARLDSIDISGDAVTVSQTDFAGPITILTPIDSSDSQVSPFAGLVFAPSERLSLYANVSRSFSPQSTRTLAAVVDPEKGEQVEVGVKSSLFDGKLSAALALYDLDKTDVAIVNSDGFTAQLGDQRSRGFELELQGRPRLGLHWLFNYAYTDAELTRFVELVDVGGGFPSVPTDRKGNTPAFVPEHQANLWVSQRFEGGLRVGGGLRWVGERFVDEDNALELDGYLLLDANLAYSFGRWEANLWLKNLTDQEYELRGFGSGSVIPADGFNLAAGLKLNL
ncbi:MAG: TonB-dependent siderophore receptor [Thermoanaerobaculia bacterium]|nr:TonB-dependent siderophore receptor [Thermoanaerobaculia bacterium]